MAKPSLPRLLRAGLEAGFAVVGSESDLRAVSRGLVEDRHREGTQRVDRRRHYPQILTEI